jgi:Uma2 family endonuclease
MITAEKFTSADLELMPEDGKRYEIIEGELYVSRQPGSEHQYTCAQMTYFLVAWTRQSGLGAVLSAPGLIFAEDDDVAPDLVWITRERLEKSLDRGLDATAGGSLPPQASPAGARRHAPGSGST